MQQPNVLGPEGSTATTNPEPISLFQRVADKVWSGSRRFQARRKPPSA
jgi:hypothetical protein